MDYSPWGHKELDMTEQLSTAQHSTYVLLLLLLSRFSCVQLLATPWTVGHQAPLSMGILQARILEWVAVLSSRGSSQLRVQTQVSRIAGRFFIV